jgi:hypothetical protein
MSTYKDHHRLPQEGEMGWQIDFSWECYTDDRLRWLYGPNHRTERQAMTQADIEAWNRLGRRSAA